MVLSSSLKKQSPEYKAFAQEVRSFLEELTHAQVPMKKTVQDWQDQREKLLQQARQDEALKSMYKRQASKCKSDCQKVMKAVDVLQTAYVQVRIQFEEEGGMIFRLPDPRSIRQKVDALAGDLIKLDLFTSHQGYEHSTSSSQLPEYDDGVTDFVGPSQKKSMSMSTSQNSLLGLTNWLGKNNNNSNHMSSSNSINNIHHKALTSEDFSILDDDDESESANNTSSSHHMDNALRPLRNLIHQMRQAQEPLKQRLRDLARKRQTLVHESKEIDLTKPPTMDMQRRIKHVEGEMRQVMEAIDCWQGHEWDLWMQMDELTKEWTARAAAGVDLDSIMDDPLTLPFMAVIQQQAQEILTKPVVTPKAPQLTSTTSARQWALEGSGGVGKAIQAS